MLINFGCNDTYFQLNRVAGKGYSCEGELVMTVKTSLSDETTPHHDLSLPVTLTGVREPNNIIQIERPADGNKL